MDWIDKYFVFPRLFLVAYYVFYAHAWHKIVDWFMVYPWNSLQNEWSIAAVAGFPSIILGILTQVLHKVTDSYMRGVYSAK